MYFLVNASPHKRLDVATSKFADALISLKAGICDGVPSTEVLFDMQSDHVLKKLNFDLLTAGSGDGGEQGSAGKIFATIVLHS